jgi:hypothetical protein
LSGGPEGTCAMQSDEYSSDNDAPEEIGLLEAKEQTLNVRKAENESKKALVNQKKLTNVKKDSILRQNKLTKKQNDFLPTEVLEDIAQSDTKKSSKPAKRKRESKKTLSTESRDVRKIVKDGVTIQKLQSAEGLISDSRKSASQDATDLIEKHFGNVKREEYFKVYSRQSGPARHFASV